MQHNAIYLDAEMMARLESEVRRCIHGAIENAVTTIGFAGRKINYDTLGVYDDFDDLLRITLGLGLNIWHERHRDEDDSNSGMAST